jgi:hypothetical protein
VSQQKRVKGEQKKAGRAVRVAKKRSGLKPIHYIAGALVLTVLVIGLIFLLRPTTPQTATGPTPTPVTTPAWIVFAPDSNFTIEQQNQMIALAQRWVAKFPCNQPQIVISRMKVETTGQFITPERADRGRIAIDPEWSYYEFKWWDPFVHSMFHACAGNSRTPSRPLELVGMHVKEFQGGRVVWAREGDLTNSRPEIEEAAAEYLAAAAVPLYHPSDDEAYIRGLANLRASGMTPEEVWQFLSVSDMEGFAARYYRIDLNVVDGSTFNDLMNVFFVKRTQ